MKVLAVDDSALSRMIICKKVKQIVPDALITQAVNGQDAVDKFTEAQKGGANFDVVFLDCLMPVKDGLTALEEIRQIDKDVPVILLTANIQHKVRERAEELGCTAFLNKTGDDSLLPGLLGVK
ncbi:MAG: response regulator [Lentisphaeraceae bacterium]|nr:response regulator [Lentisphaeraceae bacterium]